MPRRPGPKPATAQVIELRGNPSGLSREEIAARRDAVASPKFLDSAAPPKDLSRYELEAWNLHAPELVRLGLLTDLDVGAFRQMCTAYAVAKEAVDSLRPKDRRRKGLDVIVPDRKYGGVKRAPGVGLFFQAAKEYRSWCAEFGLTPSARISLAGAFVRPNEDEDDDLFDT